MARPRPQLPSREAILALEDAAGCIAVRATPSASADGIVLPRPGGPPTLGVRVTAPPEDGRANEAVLGLLAKALGQPRSSLALLRGATGRDKLIRAEPRARDR